MENRKNKFGTEAIADKNLNIFKGCKHQCIYCYAMLIGSIYRKETYESWGDMQINFDAVDVRYQKTTKTIMFSSSHDIFPNEEVHKFLDCSIKVLKRNPSVGNNIIITTKPRLEIISIITALFERYKKQITFFFTIGSHDDGILNDYEPNASSYNERLECLRLAYNKGFKTNVIIEPLLDYSPKPIIEDTINYVNGIIFVGVANHIPRLKTFYKNQNIEEFLPLLERLEIIYKYFLKSIKNVVNSYDKVIWKTGMNDKKKIKT